VSRHGKRLALLDSPRCRLQTL